MSELENPLAEKRGPRWKRKKEDRPQEILDAALELFVEQGFSATTVSQIGRKAGVTPGTLYVYYKNKEAILQKVVMKTLSPIFTESDAILESYQGSAEGLVEILIDKWWQAVGGESKISGIPKLAVAEVSNFPELANFYVQRILDPGIRYIQKVLEYGVQKGAFQISDVKFTSYLIFSVFHGAVIDAHSFMIAQKNGIPLTQFKNRLYHLILHGILKAD